LQIFYVVIKIAALSLCGSYIKWSDQSIRGTGKKTHVQIRGYCQLAWVNEMHSIRRKRASVPCPVRVEYHFDL